MRYLVRAKVKPGQEAALPQAIETGTLGQGSIAGEEYLRDMAQARLIEDGSVRWSEYNEVMPLFHPAGNCQQLARRRPVSVKRKCCPTSARGNTCSNLQINICKDTYRYEVIFLKEPLTAEEAMKSVMTKAGVDTAHQGQEVLYFSRLTSKAAQSHLTKIISLPVYQNMTIRNWNTTTTLLALLDTRAVN